MIYILLLPSCIVIYSVDIKHWPFDLFPLYQSPPPQTPFLSQHISSSLIHLSSFNVNDSVGGVRQTVSVDNESATDKY